jgi:hypothetical protein
MKLTVLKIQLDVGRPQVELSEILQISFLNYHCHSLSVVILIHLLLLRRKLEGGW